MRRLTEEQLSRIAEMREAGSTYGEIGAEIGCSAKAISWQCLRMGAELPKPKHALWASVKGPLVVQRGNHVVRRYTEEDDARLLALSADGLTYTEIGKAIGRRVNSVIGRLMTLARREERAGA